MSYYNAEHYIDSTAAIAISRADRRARKQPLKKFKGLTYKISEVLRLEYKNGVVRIWEIART